jgi:hypothetical protein
MDGCWIPDHLLEQWERSLLVGVAQPESHDGQLVWDLDGVPVAHLRWLCLPRSGTRVTHWFRDAATACTKGKDRG